MRRGSPRYVNLSAEEAAAFSLVWSEIDDKLRPVSWRAAYERRLRAVFHRWFHDENVFGAFCLPEVAFYVATGQLPETGDPEVIRSLSIHAARGEDCACQAAIGHFQTEWPEPRGEHPDAARAWSERARFCFKHNAKRPASDWVGPFYRVDSETGECFLGHGKPEGPSQDKAGRMAAEAKEREVAANRAETEYPRTGALAYRARRSRIGAIEDRREEKRALETAYGWVTDDDPLHRDSVWRQVGDTSAWRGSVEYIKQREREWITETERQAGGATRQGRGPSDL